MDSSQICFDGQPAGIDFMQIAFDAIESLGREHLGCQHEIFEHPLGGFIRLLRAQQVFGRFCHLFPLAGFSSHERVPRTFLAWLAEVLQSLQNFKWGHGLDHFFDLNGGGSEPAVSERS